MDKNQIIGILLLLGLFVGWQYIDSTNRVPVDPSQGTAVVDSSASNNKAVTSSAVVNTTKDSTNVLFEEKIVTVETDELKVYLSN